MGRVVLIFAAVLLLAGGAGFYFFKIYTPAQELQAAQNEVTRWEARFQAARDCLLGKTPGSAKTSEALTIHEMAPDPWDRGKCTPLIGKLTRGEADDTGLPAIETAWADLDKAAQKAAMAFATHVGSSTTVLADPLPTALDALDEARSNLRKAAKLPPTGSAGPTLPVAQLLPLADGADPITNLEIDAVPSAHGIVLFGRTASRDVQVTLTAGGAAKIDRVGPSSLRAVPDTSWGATPGADGVHVGSFDVEGAMPTTTSTIKAATTVATVLGTPTEGVVVAGNDTELYFARGATIYPPVKISFAQVSSDVDGRAVAIGATADKYQARIVDARTDGLTFDIDDGIVNEPPCLAADRAWVLTLAGAASLGATTQATSSTPFPLTKLQGCTSEGALFRSPSDASQVVVCMKDCRQAALPAGAPSDSAVTIVGGNVVAIAVHNGILGVWREGGAPAFYSLDKDVNPARGRELTAMAMTDGKVIDVIARAHAGYVVVRLPAH
jgi:hypothetical protein